MSATYENYIQRARYLARGADKQRKSLMDLLIRLEPQRRYWAESGEPTWAAFLKAEGFCTHARFKAYKRALALSLDIKSLGVEGACLLASLPEKEGVKVQRRAIRWIHRHDVPPTYQRIALYLRQERGPQAPKRNPARENRLLRAYVVILKNRLKKANIRIPVMPKDV